jgi:hypothetical protein
MKRTPVLCQALFLVASAHATTVNFTTFDEQIVYGTDTLENPSGTVIETLQHAGWGTEIPSDIAADFSDLATLIPVYPSAAAFIQSTASQAALITDLDFLTADASPTTVEVWSGGPPVIGVADVANSAEVAGALYPGYSLVSASTPITLGQVSYTTGASENPTTAIEGTVTFNLYEIDLVERQIASVPEPSTLLLSGAVVLLFARWRRRLK